ncbi:MAG: AbrB family transcriptional regulator [Rhodocyclaceae bacterium]
MTLAVLAGAAAQRLDVPLPWMIGPLFSVALLRVAGVRLEALPGGRQAGQWAIGTALGLYFTPAVVAQLAQNAPLVLVVAVASLFMGAVCAGFMLAFGRVDRSTAFFASLPGGASEMASLAERAVARVDRVAAAHALRVMMVVSVVPFALTWYGPRGGDPGYVAIATAVDWARFPTLAGIGVAGAMIFTLLRLANAWVLGPLFAVALVTALEYRLTALPGVVVNAGQVLIGCSLGVRFSPEFFRAAPRFMTVAALGALLGLMLAFGLAAALATLVDVPLATLSLATAPGGVAEMAITAKVLQLGVPLITACHVLRVVVLTLAAAPAFRLFERVMVGRR